MFTDLTNGLTRLEERNNRTNADKQTSADSDCDFNASVLDLLHEIVSFLRENHTKASR